MRKKLVALVGAAMILAALPAMAFADPADAPANEPPAPTAEAEVAAAAESRYVNFDPLVSKDVSMQIECTGIEPAFSVVDGPGPSAPALYDGAASFSFTASKVGYAVVGVKLTGNYADCKQIKVLIRDEDLQFDKQIVINGNGASSGFWFWLSDVGYDISVNSPQDVRATISVVPVGGTDPETPETPTTPENPTTPDTKTPTGIDTGSKSPKTGLDFGGIAGASLGMLVAAGGVGYALRKKLAK